MEEKINEYVAEARKFAERILGLELKFGELYELRQDVEHVINIFENNSNKIEPWGEAAFIFLNRNYGTQFYNNIDVIKFKIQRHEDKKTLGYDYYPEYFKRVQEEMHFP